MTPIELQAALNLPITDEDAASAQAISRAIMATLPQDVAGLAGPAMAGLALALSDVARHLGQPIVIDAVARAASTLLRDPAAPFFASPPHPAAIAAVVASLDPASREAAETWAANTAAPLLRACDAAAPPIHQLGPLLAAMHVLTGLGLLLGDESFITIAADFARKALRDGHATTATILRSAP